MPRRGRRARFRYPPRWQRPRFHLIGGIGRVGDGQRRLRPRPCRRGSAALPFMVRKGPRAASMASSVGWWADRSRMELGRSGRKSSGAGRQVRARVVDRLEGVAGDLLGGDILVNDLVDEAGIGAVLQQAPHEIGQQVAMRAHGGVDAAAGALALQDDVVQRLAHAVQALELECRSCRPGHFEDSRGRVRVVGGELRVDPVGHRQQLARALAI